MVVEGIEGVREGLPTTWAEVLFGENLSSDARISKISGSIIGKFYPNPNSHRNTNKSYNLDVKLYIFLNANANKLLAYL